MDLIGQLAGALNVDQGKATSAAGALLGVIQQNAPQGALDGLMAKAPQAAGWLAAAKPLLGGPAPSSSAAGLLGGLLGGLGGGDASQGGGMLGGLAALAQGASGLSALTGTLEKLGIPPDAVAKALPLILSFVQHHLGDAGLTKLVAEVPMLKEVAGALGGSGAAAGGTGQLGGILSGLMRS